MIGGAGGRIRRRHAWASVGLAALAAVTSCALSAAAHAAPGKEITFYLGLERPEGKARTAFSQVGTPGSPAYRSFDEVGSISRRYGASRLTRRALAKAARRHGISARVDPSGVFARIRAPKRRLERVFGVKIRVDFNNDVLANTYSVANDRLRLPRDLRPLVREVVAEFARTTKPSNAPQRAARGTPPAPGNAGTWTDGCAEAQATGAYSFEQVRTAYGIDAIAPGPASVAILGAGEGPKRADLAANGACFGYPKVRARTLLTDGQARAFGPASPEPSEDLALVRGMAPRLESLTFAQVWLAPELWFLGPADVLAAGSLPDALSMSYGECERAVRGRSHGATRATRAGADLLDSILLRLGLAGVGVFASAGDFGSTCNGSPFAGVTWPASSPYATAVGGTRLVLDASNSRVDEVVWNDLEWLTTENGGGAGGGGLSEVSPRPPYQQAIPAPGALRAVPDISAHASMLPGWPVVVGGNWLADAGTSASAPLLAGAFAGLSAAERAAGRTPLGPVNGLVYALASAAPASLFDVVAGNNGYDAQVPAQVAAIGYDLASGLGVPRFDQLAAALPAPAAP